MDAESEIREFLTSRRARISPERAGLPIERRKRRVSGLRREEVAVLAGVSAEYYTRLERGHVGGVSDSVLEALARALQLDEAERAHLLDLVRATRAATGRRRVPSAHDLRPNVQHVLDAIAAPALLHNRCMEIVAANHLGRALHTPVFAGPVRPVSHARFLFLDPRARTFYVDWEVVAKITASYMRAEAAHEPDDQALSDLIAELSVRSERFRAWWAAHDVRFYASLAPLRFRHPVVGDISLTFEPLEFVANPELKIAVYLAEPGSASEQTLTALARSDTSTRNGD
ncbi:MAG: helix-turn-helix transcriptional regulator [Actinomycetota bacterium]|nr:helix-turn-helix transcriptional regulator [Actinomycetota bacterium]